MNTYCWKIADNYFGIMPYHFRIFSNAALAQTNDYMPLSSSAKALTRIPFNQTIPVDEVYRKEFENCDNKDMFK